MDLGTLLLLSLLGIGLLVVIFRARLWPTATRATAAATPATATGPDDRAERHAGHDGAGSSVSDAGRHASCSGTDDDRNHAGSQGCC